jgi:tetratricopeptide (TPR) repeat protein
VSRRLGVVVVALLVGGGAVLLGRDWLSERQAQAEAKRRDDLAYAAQWDLDHGAPQQALEKLRALEEVDPTRKGLTSALGRALVSTGAAADALPVLARAFQRDGPTAETLEYQAVAMAQLGRHDEARAALERSLSLTETSSAFRRLAQANLALGEIGPAIASWEHAAALAPVPERAAIMEEATALLTAAGHPDAGIRWPAAPRSPPSSPPPAPPAAP